MNVKNPIHKFYIDQLSDVEKKIIENKKMLNELTENQTSLKRGKVQLAKLIREITEGKWHGTIINYY